MDGFKSIFSKSPCFPRAVAPYTITELLSNFWYDLTSICMDSVLGFLLGQLFYVTIDHPQIVDSLLESPCWLLNVVGVRNSE